MGNENEDLTRLERYETFRCDVVAELASTEGQLRDLKTAGKTRTATYQQLFANRLTLRGILERLADHGI
jgi:hypothetical protein